MGKIILAALILLLPAVAQPGKQQQLLIAQAASTAAPITLITHTFSQASVASSSVNTTGSTLFVSVCTYNGGGSCTVADSKSNTWTTKVTSATDLSSNRTQLKFVSSPTTNASHTFSCDAGNFGTCYILAFGNTKTSSPDDQSNSAISAAATTIQPGLITPTSDGQVVVTGVGAQFLTGTASINSSYTITDQSPNNGTTANGGGAAYLVQNSAAATNPTWTIPTSLVSSAVSASFKAP